MTPVARLLAIAWAGAALAGAAAAAERLLVLPVADETGVAGAAAAVEERLAAGLAARGWRLADAAPAEEYLRSGGLRALDSLPAAAVDAVLEASGADHLLLTRVVSWIDGPSPIVAISARLLGRGAVPAGAALAALGAAETERAFGIGRASTLSDVTDRAVERLLDGLPRPHRAAPSGDGSAGVRRFAGAGAPATWCTEGLFERAPARFATLPFAAPAEARDAARIAAELVARRLEAAGELSRVEPADFRAALVAERIPSLRYLAPDRLEGLGRRLGTTLFLRGRVWRWREARPAGDNPGAEVELDFELVDVAAGRILCSSRHAGTATDFERAFLRGGVGSAVALADRLAAEMVASARRGGFAAPPVTPSSAPPSDPSGAPAP